MRSQRENKAGFSPWIFTLSFLVPYFIISLSLKLAEILTLRRQIDISEIIVVILKLNLETLCYGFLLWPLFYVRTSIGNGLAFCLYILALMFNLLSYAVSVRFSTPLNGFILGKLGEFATFLSVYVYTSPLFWKLSLLLILLAFFPVICRWFFSRLVRFPRINFLLTRFIPVVAIGLGAFGLSTYFFYQTKSRLAFTFFESTIRSTVYELHSRRSPSQDRDTFSFRQIVPLVPRTKRHARLEGGKGLNVVVYLLESIPYEFYKPEKRQEPNASGNPGSLAKHSIIYRNHYTTSLYSNLAFYSLITGRMGVFGNRYEYLFLKNPILHRMKKAGYSTAILTTVHYRMDFMTYVLKNILQFDFMYEPTADLEEAKRYKHVGGFTGQAIMIDDQIIVDKALKWLKGQTKKPFFLILQPQNSHYPYWCPKKKLRVSKEDTLHGKFMNAVQCQDALISRLLEGMENLGVLDDTLFVITSDHGLTTVFPELRDKYLEDEESLLFNDINIRVPLLFYNRRLFRETTYVDELSSHLDLMPTIFDIVGVDYALKDVDGRSIFQNEKNGLVISTLGYNREAVALVGEDMKLRYDYLNNFGTLYDKRDLTRNSRNDGEIRKDLARWVERVKMWERLMSKVRR